MPDEQAKPELPDDLLGRKAIAKRLRVSPKTVTRWDREGLLPEPDFQCGTMRRWRRDRLEAWIRMGGTRSARQLAAEESPKGGGKTGQIGTKGNKSPPAAKDP